VAEGSVDEPESMEIEPAGPNVEKGAGPKIEEDKNGIIEISDSEPDKKKNKKTLQSELSIEEQDIQETAENTASQNDVPGSSNDSMRAPFKNLSNNSPNAKKAQKKITSFYTKKEATKKRKKEK
jgi:hypothetical protein